MNSSWKKVAATVCVMTALCGCGGKSRINGWNPLKWGKPQVEYATAQNPTVQITSIWKAAEGTGLSGVPTRGFAGEILFFSRRQASPTAVKGNVRIYVFDDIGTKEEQSKPIHQFDFPSEVWNLHMKADGPVGTTYQLFIPYTKKDYHMTQCTLRVRLQPENGPVVYSDMAKVTLPGPVRKKEYSRTSLTPKSDRRMKMNNIPLEVSADNAQPSVRPALHEVPQTHHTGVPVKTYVGARPEFNAKQVESSLAKMFQKLPPAETVSKPKPPLSVTLESQPTTPAATTPSRRFKLTATTPATGVNDAGNTGGETSSDVSANHPLAGF